MKTKTTGALSALTWLALTTINVHFATALAQDTAFTYQGRLDSGGVPVDGRYDLLFTLYATNIGGIALAGPVTNSVVSVTNGLFTTLVDFGNVFSGGSNWLEIAVSTNGANAFTTLAPRQRLAATPYAITAGALAGGFAIRSNTNGAPNLIGGSSLNYAASNVIGATIAGGGAASYFGSAYSNSVSGDLGTVSGGAGNTASGTYAATVGGGFLNTASGYYATVGGGSGNVASGYYAAVGGGSGNIASNLSATVSGGYQNTAGGQFATVGGYYNTATGDYATIAGGEGNVASGTNATVGGGYFNIASGMGSFAAGSLAEAAHSGSFVWADNSVSAYFLSTANNQFSVRAAGGIRLAGDVQLANDTYHYLSLNGGNALGYLYGSFHKFADGVHLGYNYYADAGGGNHIFNTGGATSRLTTGYGFVGIYIGGVNAVPSTERLYADSTGVRVDGTFNNNSDRNAKQDFQPVSSSQMLDKVSRLPVSEWSYKEDPQIRHIGPMAQDFHAAFNIGTDDKHIAPIDEGGVALAAIQGLNQKVNELTRENAELKHRLDVLAQIISKQKQN